MLGGEFYLTYSPSKTNANIVTDAVAKGWGKQESLVVIINSGVTISSTSTGSPALTTTGWLSLPFMPSGRIDGEGRPA